MEISFPLHSKPFLVCIPLSFHCTYTSCSTVWAGLREATSEQLWLQGVSRELSCLMALNNGGTGCPRPSQAGGLAKEELCESSADPEDTQVTLSSPQCNTELATPLWPPSEVCSSACWTAFPDASVTERDPTLVLADESVRSDVCGCWGRSLQFNCEPLQSALFPPGSRPTAPLHQPESSSDCD